MEAVATRAPARTTPAPADSEQARTATAARPKPAWRHEIDAATTRMLRRACDCGGTCGGCDDERALRRSACGPAPAEAPSAVHDVLRTPGRPLDGPVRAVMESTLAHDLGPVRVHDDAAAASSARAVGAIAYTVGNDVVFDTGRYAPATPDGERLLVHELTHVVQQRGAPEHGPIVVGRPGDAAETEAERVAAGGTGTVAATGSRRLSRSCGAAVPTGGPCAGVSGVPVGDRFDFAVNCDDLLPGEEARLRTYPARVGAGDTVEIHGVASVDGSAAFNEELSCARAMRAQSILSAELTARGIAATLTLHKHGATPGPAHERRSVVLSPVTRPPEAVSCTGHVLGTRGACGSGPDFTFHDFPALGLADSLKVVPFRPLPDAALEATMEFDALTGLSTIGGAAGHDAMTQFTGGTGTSVVHGTTSILGSLAAASPRFTAGVAAVQAELAAELRTQAAAGAIDCTRISLPAARLPNIHFRFSLVPPLEAVIGGTQGLTVRFTSFVADAATRTYTIGLQFEICDDFGVSAADLYAPSLIAFWLLQHERAGYRPFVNVLDLPATVSGTF